MGRISRATMFMMMARAAAMRSTCHRLNVGAIVTRHNNPVSVGWNGAAAGLPHCAGNECAGIVPGRCGTLHAEVNAITKANALLMEFDSPLVDLYVTHSPCGACSDAIVSPSLNARVQRLFFEVPYRNTQHLGIFADTGVEVYEVTPAGYIVEYFTRKVVELP